MEGGGLLSLTDSPHLCNDQTMSSTSVDAFSILVVDDDITCLAIVAAILKKFNYEVVTVKHPNDALCTLRIKGGAFDLVVSDVHMPDMNGFELQQAIAREFNLPVVLMSADESEGVALKGLESGAAFFIMKPVNPDDLRDLWQFAALKKMENQSVNNKNNNHNIQEISDKKTSSENANVSDQVGVCESSSDAGMKTTESKKKSPRKEGSEEGDGEKSQQKRPKIVWTNSLHNRFLEAIRSIGLDRAVPKKILEVMNVPGLTRENVASHLQKYRIFLRRVSDASYKIQYSSLNIPLKSSSCESSRDTTSPSTPMFNKYTTHTYQNLAPLSNREAPSSSRQSSLLSNRENWRNPSIENATLISRQHDHTRGAAHVRNNYAAGPTFPSQENVGTLGVATSSLPLRNPTYRSNYVGYKISDIHRITEKFINTGPDNGRNKTNPPVGQLQSNIEVALNDSASAGLSGNIRVDESVPPIIPTAHSTADHNKQLNFGGEVDRESGFSPMFDLSEFDFLSAQQALETTLANQNQSQQNNGDLGFNFNGDMAHGDDGFNAPNSFDQPPNQVQVQNNQLNNSQGFASSSQLNEAVTLLNDEHQDLTNSMDFGSIALQQNMPIFSPIYERNDDDFLESLLAPFGDDHPFS